MPQKIAIITPTFPPYRGGMGKLAELDAKQLAELGHEVHVYRPEPRQPAAAPAQPFAVHDLRPWFRFGNAALVPDVRRVLRQYPLVFLHYPFFGAAEIVAWCRRSAPGTKLVIVYHMDVVGRGLLGAFFRWHTRWCLPRILRTADRVIVTSFDYLNSSNAEPLRKRQVKFRELAPSVDSARFAPDGKPTRLLSRYGLKADDRVVLFVGGLDRAHYFKGIPSLLQALMIKELAGARAVIVGDGDLRPEYEKLAAKLGPAGRVVFAGGVSDEDLPDHYRLADVFAFPSVDRSEAFGVAALEALASGVPVVASDLPGVRTIVRQGETGFRAPPGSVSGLAAGLVRVLNDDILRRRLGAAARQMVTAEYSDEVRRKRLQQIVTEVLAATNHQEKK